MCRVRLLEVGQVVVDEMRKRLRWVHALLSSSALPCDPREAPIRQWYNKRRRSLRDAWTVVRGRHAYRQPRGRHTASVEGPARGGSRRSRRHQAHGQAPPPPRHSGRMLSFHAHNTRVPAAPDHRQADRRAHVALVTDAGTPGVSDPGAELVEAARSQGIRSRWFRARGITGGRRGVGVPAGSPDGVRVSTCSVKRPQTVVRSCGRRSLIRSRSSRRHTG